ncbi:hypothetical protein Btru_045073 [Bulinus truncatus]|nr:hypothetical protein Btru_045073 [Bulinus truncatus]
MTKIKVCSPDRVEVGYLVERKMTLMKRIYCSISRQLRSTRNRSSRRAHFCIAMSICTVSAIVIAESLRSGHFNILQERRHDRRPSEISGNYAQSLNLNVVQKSTEIQLNNSAGESKKIPKVKDSSEIFEVQRKDKHNNVKDVIIGGHNRTVIDLGKGQREAARPVVPTAADESLMIEEEINTEKKKGRG